MTQVTQKEEELLIKDLCTRLPYGVVIKITSDGGMVEASYDMRLDAGVFADLLNSEDDFIPYLRPMSSMTEEDRKEFFSLADNSSYLNIGSNDDEVFVWDDTPVPMIDWLNAHHFDYRGLIDEGLVIEAPEGMYT